MPADPSHNPLNRRATRKLTSEEEVDSRRARGEVSAADRTELKSRGQLVIHFLCRFPALNVGGMMGLALVV